MPRGVPRNVDDLEAQAEDFDMIALRERLERLRNALARRTEHRCAGGFVQRGHAAGVIGMMVRD